MYGIVGGQNKTDMRTLLTKRVWVWKHAARNKTAFRTPLTPHGMCLGRCKPKRAVFGSACILKGRVWNHAVRNGRGWKGIKSRRKLKRTVTGWCFLYTVNFKLAGSCGFLVGSCQVLVRFLSSSCQVLVGPQETIPHYY